MVKINDPNNPFVQIMKETDNWKNFNLWVEKYSDYRNKELEKYVEENQEEIYNIAYKRYKEANPEESPQIGDIINIDNCDFVKSNNDGWDSLYIMFGAETESSKIFAYVGFDFKDYDTSHEAIKALGRYEYKY